MPTKAMRITEPRGLRDPRGSMTTIQPRDGDPRSVFVVSYEDGHAVECFGHNPEDAGERASKTYPGVKFTVSKRPVRVLSS